MAASDAKTPLSPYAVTLIESPSSASAASIVLVHNRPSGDPEPSEEDLAITKRLVEVGELLGIGVLDHVILASRGVVSLRSLQQM